MNIASGTTGEVEIRPAGVADAEAVADVVRRAFGDAEGSQVADLVATLGASGHVRASLVAEAVTAEAATDPDGGVVGHVMLSRSWVDARDRLVEVVVLSPLSVDPGHQRRGVGTTLVAAAVAAAEDLGAPAVFLEGSPSWYAARGFVPATPLGFERPSVRIPEPAFQVTLLDEDDGARGRLVYCDPFWRHDSVGLRDPDLAELEAALAED